MSLIPPNPTTSEEDFQVCTPEHCFYAFDTLFTTLTKKKAIQPKFADEKFPLFVTWNVRCPGKQPRLRGCIGNFEAQPLHEGLSEYALISAFQDHRFRKIESRELDSLECSISLLTDFEDASSYLDWTVGVHGIQITFPHPSFLASDRSEAPSPLSSSSSIPTRSNLKHSFSSTYLPQVAEEQGWNKIEAIDSAIQKAGWNGRITEDIRRSIRLRRYQSKAYTVGWDEYVEWREANGGSM
ncbi:hypothetical protein EUX98_g572 [Antrodiella citrinella]|uniref:AMMECR1 domain-containing protein n=1 Tax=Antrodiella citrinella TaxID=2447956 RepID=A0A4S4N6I3_9APHY|nr:hypothetical protein EUX98_g572 [Antrodiella citrinella]